MTETLEIGRAFTEIVEPQLPAIAVLCRRLGVQCLDLFGSVLTNRFDPERSDLDFLVAFQPMPAGQYATACRELRAVLEQLFARRVDLLTENALVNPYLRRQIEAEKRRLYPAV
jgi:predicted nucleotidyltransferase